MPWTVTMALRHNRMTHWRVVVFLWPLTSGVFVLHLKTDYLETDERGVIIQLLLWLDMQHLAVCFGSSPHSSALNCMWPNSPVYISERFPSPAVNTACGSAERTHVAKPPSIVRIARTENPFLGSQPSVWDTVCPSVLRNLLSLCSRFF